MLPVMVNLDGFVLTHTYELLHTVDQDKVDAYIPYQQFANRMDLDNPKATCITAGPLYNMEFRYQQHQAMLNAVEKIKAAADGLGIAAGHGLLVQAVELALTDELGVAGVAGDGDQLVDDGGVDGVGGDAPHLGQLVAHERAEVAGVLAAGTLKAVLDHGVVDGIGTAGDGTQNAAAAGDCVEGLAVEAALLEAVQNDIGAELRLIGDVVIGRELINRVAQGLLEQLVLILEDSDLRGRGAGVDYQNFV